MPSFRQLAGHIEREFFGSYLGDLDTALNYLEKAYGYRDPVLITLKYFPAVPASLRGDLRFQNLLERIVFTGLTVFILISIVNYSFMASSLHYMRFCLMTVPITISISNADLPPSSIL